jgi:hypothetical protein
VKVIVGGAVITRQFVESIGADGYEAIPQEYEHLSVKELVDITGKVAIITGGKGYRLWLCKTVGLCSKRVVW